MELGEFGAQRGFEGFGVFVDYAVVAIVELCVMEDLALSLSALRSEMLSRGGRGGGHVPAHSPSQSPQPPCKSFASDFATHPISTALL